MADDEYLFETLARDIAARHVKDSPNIPASAAELAMSIITTGIASTKFRQDPAKTVASICNGVLAGVSQAGGDLPDAAVAILHHVTHMSDALPPAEVRAWAIAGIAKAASAAGHDVRDSAERKIEAHFKGEGAVYSAACKRAEEG